MGKLLHCLGVAGIFFFAAIGVHAQDRPAAPSFTTTAGTFDSTKEAFVYEQVRGQMRYQLDGTGSMVTYAKIRVQTYGGVQQLGQLVFPYDSANATLDVRLIRVTKPDGKIVTAGLDAIQDMTSPVAESAPMYTDLRQKHKTSSNLW